MPSLMATSLRLRTHSARTKRNDRERNADENKTGEEDSRNTQTSQLWGPREKGMLRRMGQGESHKMIDQKLNGQRRSVQHTRPNKG